MSRESHSSPSLETCYRAVTALLGASDRLERRFTAIVRPHGVTLQQYNVLRILRGAEPDGLPTMEVRARMLEKAPGITRLMDRLEAKSLVRRQTVGSDRRAVSCRITREGKDLLRRLDRPMDRADREVFAGISERRLRSLCRMLDEVAPAT